MREELIVLGIVCAVFLATADVRLIGFATLEETTLGRLHGSLLNQSAEVRVIVTLVNYSTDLPRILADYPGSKELGIIDSVALQVPQEMLRGLAEKDYVADLFLDTKVKALRANALQGLHVPGAWNLSYNSSMVNGKGVRVAIIDTGVDDSHPEFHCPGTDCAVLMGSNLLDGNLTSVIRNLTLTTFPGPDPSPDFNLSAGETHEIQVALQGKPTIRRAWLQAYFRLRYPGRVAVQIRGSTAGNVTLGNLTARTLTTLSDGRSHLIVNDSNVSTFDLQIRKDSQVLGAYLNLTGLEQNGSYPKNVTLTVHGARGWTAELVGTEKANITFPVLLAIQACAGSPLALCQIPVHVAVGQGLVNLSGVELSYLESGSFNTTFGMNLTVLFSWAAGICEPQRCTVPVQVTSSQEGEITLDHLSVSYFSNDTRIAGLYMDDSGHGTECAGIVHMVAPNASILAYKALNQTGEGYSSDVIRAIEQAVDDGADILSVSLGEGWYNDTCDTDPMAKAVNRAVEEGLVVLGAVGNNHSQSTMSPACAGKAIRVGAIGSLDQLAAFSNYGPLVDVVAYGVHINTTTLNQSYTDRAANETEPNVSDQYLASGTSMATSFVAGVLALYHGAYHSVHGSSPLPDHVKDRLRNTSEDLGSPGRDDSFGYGKPNITAMLEEFNPPAADIPGEPAVPIEPRNEHAGEDDDETDSTGTTERTPVEYHGKLSENWREFTMFPQDNVSLPYASMTYVLQLQSIQPGYALLRILPGSRDYQADYNQTTLVDVDGNSTNDMQLVVAKLSDTSIRLRLRQQPATTAATCYDGVVDQDETGVDCGGVCGPCGMGMPCLRDEDCAEVCTAGRCSTGSRVVVHLPEQAARATCSDRIRNQGEEGIDCGGPCAKCAESGADQQTAPRTERPAVVAPEAESKSLVPYMLGAGLLALVGAGYVVYTRVRPGKANKPAPRFQQGTPDSVVLRSYVAQNLSRGSDLVRVRQALLGSGWNATVVDDALQTVLQLRASPTQAVGTTGPTTQSSAPVTGPEPATKHLTAEMTADIEEKLLKVQGLSRTHGLATQAGTQRASR